MSRPNQIVNMCFESVRVPTQAQKRGCHQLVRVCLMEMCPLVVLSVSNSWEEKHRSAQTPPSDILCATRIS